jgi:transposase
MRGQQERTGPLFSYVSSEDRIPKGHPLRQVRRLADQALDRLNPTFCRLYPEGGRPSIPPEQLLLALMLQAIYGIRSERMLIEQLDYNLLFRWFVGLAPDDPVWHQTTYGLRPTSSTPRTATGCSTRSSCPGFWSCCWLLLRSSRC